MGKKFNTDFLILQLEGITCASCVLRVERALKRIDGVLDATVNLATEQAQVKIDPNKIDFRILKEVIEKTGYQVIDTSEKKFTEEKLILEDILSKENVIMITGDNYVTAQSIAEKVGIKNVFASVLPSEKATLIKELKGKNKIIAMVGDGINDAPALAEADVSIAMSTGSDIAIETADITLMRNDPLDVYKAIKLSHITIKAIKQNLFWAFFYNVIGIPLAAFGILNPMIAAIAMSLSSVSVVTNSLRIKSKNS